jgi:hypothetical protein
MAGDGGERLIDRAMLVRAGSCCGIDRIGREVGAPLISDIVRSRSPR